MEKIFDKVKVNFQDSMKSFKLKKIIKSNKRIKNLDPFLEKILSCDTISHSGRLSSLKKEGEELILLLHTDKPFTTGFENFYVDCNESDYILNNDNTNNTSYLFNHSNEIGFLKHSSFSSEKNNYVGSSDIYVKIGDKECLVGEIIHKGNYSTIKDLRK